MLRFLPRLFHRQTSHVTSAAILLGGASLVSRGIGLVRDRLLASHFGAGASLDAYYAAFRWPDALYNLLIVGALTAGFIPVLAECHAQEGEKAAAQFAGRILSLVAAVMALVSLALIALAPWIVPATVVGFSPEQIAETITLTRLMALSPLLLGISAVMGGVLQATKRFIAFATAPIFYNLGIIFGITCLAPSWGIRGVAIGVVIGAGLHALVQAWPVLRAQTLILDWPNFRDIRLRRVLSLMGPRTIGLGITQLNLVILLALASSLEDGSVSVLSFANNVQSVPLGLIGISFAVAALPALAEAAAKKDRAQTTQLVTSITRQVLFLVIPLAAWLILLRIQAVRLLLGQGAFDWNDTRQTALLVGWFAISLPAQALIPLFARVWYAHQQARIPLLIGVVAEAVNIASAFLLRKYVGVAGLAIAFSLSAFVQVIGLRWLLRRQGLVDKQDPWKDVWKLVLALGLSLIAGYGMRQLVGTIVPLRYVWQVLWQAGASGIVCLITYGLVAHLTRIPEWQELVQLIRQRIWKKTSSLKEVDATDSQASASQ